MSENFESIERKAPRSKSKVSRRKAREILHHGSVHEHTLTDRQRRFFGYLSNKEEIKENA